MMTAFTIEAFSNASFWKRLKLWYVSREGCVCVFCVCVCVFLCAHVQWLWWWRWGLPPCVGLGAESRWARDGAENLYWLFFVPQSCLAVVKAASTSWEANCSIYTGRHFLFFHFFFQTYFFILQWEMYLQSTVSEYFVCFFHGLNKTDTIKRKKSSSDEKVKAGKSCPSFHFETSPDMYRNQEQVHTIYNTILH